MNIQINEKICLNGEWTFQPIDSFDKKKYKIYVPSHWTHGQCWGYPKEWVKVKKAVLTRKVSIPLNWEEKYISIYFEAVMLKAEVYVNDRLVGEHSGGFTPFEINLGELGNQLAGKTFELKVIVNSAECAKEGNKLLYQVSYPSGSEEGPLPGGIWQSVWLVNKPLVHIKNWHYTCSIKKDIFNCYAILSNNSYRDFYGKIRLMVLDKGQYKDFVAGESIKINEGGITSISFKRKIKGLP